MRRSWGARGFGYRASAPLQQLWARRRHGSDAPPGVCRWRDLPGHSAAAGVESHEQRDQRPDQADQCDSSAHDPWRFAHDVIECVPYFILHHYHSLQKICTAK